MYRGGPEDKKRESNSRDSPMSLSGVYSTTTYSDTYIMHRCKAKRNASLLSMTLYKKSGESQKGRSPLFVRFMLETLVTLYHVRIERAIK